MAIEILKNEFRFINLGSWKKRFSGYAGTVFLQTLIGLVNIFVGLSVLEPTDYGVYAIVSIITLVVASLATGPVGILSTGAYLRMAAPEQDRANTTFLVLSFFFGTLFTGLLYVVWSLAAVPLGLPLGNRAGVFAILSVLPQALVLMYTSLYYNQGFSGRLFACTFAQGLCSVIAMFFGLFVLQWKETSLYLAQLIGCSAFVLVSLFQCKKLIHSLDKSWALKWFQSYISFGSNTIVTNIPQAAESIAITEFIGLGGLAIWQHAKIYGSFLSRGCKIIGLTAWPVALAEAEKGNFYTIQRIWGLIYISLALIGVISVFIAEPLVAFLTHHKLAEASVLIPWWVIYCIFQNTGREAEAVLYSTDHGQLAANAQSFAKTIGLIALFYFVWIFGLSGAMGAAILEVLCFRFFMRRAALRLKSTPILDSLAFVCVAPILLAICIENSIDQITWKIRLLGALVGILLILIFSRKIILEALNLLKTKDVEGLS